MSPPLGYEAIRGDQRKRLMGTAFPLAEPSISAQLPGSPRDVSEARVGKKRTGARRVCALSIERHEGSRPWLRRTRSYANSMLGMSGVEVCPDDAVVQGTRNWVRKSGEVVLPGVQWEKMEVEIC